MPFVPNPKATTKKLQIITESWTSISLTTSNEKHLLEDEATLYTLLVRPSRPLPP